MQRRKRRKRIPGAKYGMLTILEEINHTTFKCLCDCGAVKDISVRCLRDSDRLCSCGCQRHPKGADNSNWKGSGVVSGRYFSVLIKSAEKRGISFDLTIGFLYELLVKQNNRCALSGIEIHCNDAITRLQTASLDRIDSTKGYIVGNVQWVHKDINKMKQNYQDEYFIVMCKHVASHNTEKENHANL